MLGASERPTVSSENGTPYNRKIKRAIAKELHSVPTSLLWDELAKRNDIEYHDMDSTFGKDYFGWQETCCCEILVRKEE